MAGCSATTDQEIGAFFDQCAEKRLMYAFDDAEKAKLEAFLSAWNIQPGQRILEPGCGSGRLTMVLAEQVGINGEVFACDLSGTMIELARERNLPAQAVFSQQSTLVIPRENGWFDQVICLNVFPHIADKGAALREYARLLKPGGFLWINHFTGREDLNLFHQQAAPEVSTHELPCAVTLQELLAQNGFELVELINEPERYLAKAQRKQ